MYALGEVLSLTSVKSTVVDFREIVELLEGNGTVSYCELFLIVDVRSVRG